MRIRMLVSLLCLVALAQSQLAWSEGAGFRRWSPVVSNLEDTIHLYTDILGFELGEVSTDPPESYVYKVFNVPPGVVTRHAVFHDGDQKRVLSIVEIPGLPPQETEGVRRSLTLFNARGRFDAIVKMLKADGYETLPPQALGSSGIEMGFFDRDGHLYALYEIPYQGSYLTKDGKP